ncbi:DUF2637 domain-containing protein [Streptomyces inhibens]|uniref:DUF2637 domain-containing protein n=1 Tax=Streptomyces inhibens TaxID=2293571 RepID=UPI00369D09CB
MRPKLRLDAVLVQAVIAGALSFAHLHDIAEAAGQDGWKAWAYPISVDLLLVAAWHRLRVLRISGGAVRAAWTWFAVALTASLGANIATAGLLDLNAVPAWLRILVAGWPALAFLGGTLLVHTPAPAATDDESEEADVEDAIDDVLTDPVSPAEPTPAPELLAATESPAAIPAPDPEELASPIEVPSALVSYARTIADTHKATTGTPIDTDTLSARLGVPADMAGAIALQLA